MINSIKPYNKLFSFFKSDKSFNNNLSSGCIRLFSCKSLKPPWRILFFGTDEFALESIKPLCAKLRTGTLMSSLGIVTKKDSLISKFGKSENLPLYNWPIKISDIKSNYDIGIAVSFGNLIPENIINEFPLGCINVHASLLPRWRGAAPIIHAIMAGDTETGVSIMRIHPHKFDVGEIIRQYRIPIEWDETAVQLEKKLALLGSQVLMECLRDLQNSLKMCDPQPETGITYAPKVKADMAKVDFTTIDSKSVYNLHRALSHIHLLKTTLQHLDVRLKNVSLDEVTSKKPRINSKTDTDIDLQKSALDFLNVSVKEVKKTTKKIHNKEGGKCFYDKSSKSLKVVCADDQCVIIGALQIGSKHLSAVDFYNGYLSKMKSDEWKFK